MPTDDTPDDRATDAVVDTTERGDDEFGTAVLTTIAEELDAEPTSLPPLRDSIDPELLNALPDSEGESVTTLSFEYVGHEVLVTSDGAILLRSLV